MATRIQKSWRGHFSRKAKFSYQGLQCWLAQIKTENCHIAKKSHQFLVESEESCLSSKRRYLDEMCNRLHFLQRTRNIPGVFSNRHSKELSQIEKCLNGCRRFRKYQIRTRYMIGDNFLLCCFAETNSLDIEQIVLHNLHFRFYFLLKQ